MCQGTYRDVSVRIAMSIRIVMYRVSDQTLFLGDVSRSVMRDTSGLQTRIGAERNS